MLSEDDEVSADCESSGVCELFEFGELPEVCVCVALLPWALAGMAGVPVMGETSDDVGGVVAWAARLASEARLNISPYPNMKRGLDW
jgi:hypothetical protein